MQSVTAVFDIGRSNKKFFLFDEDFREVHREYVTFEMIEDEDGFPTEDVDALSSWLCEVFHRILEAREYHVKAINFSSYGASFVHLDADGQVLTPLYNYEKALPQVLSKDFERRYGPGNTLTMSTGSPPSGMLNSGMQLYWLKHHRPKVFRKIKYSLHLPQFLSYVFTGIPISEYTSIGCHTALWDYGKGDYHKWVYKEDIHRVLPPIVSTETSINMNYNGRRMKIGVGIHDSSAALLPYIRSERKPFVLISTGTWSISLNPFAEGQLTQEDLDRNCINYMRIDGKPVKAARLFLGEEYKHQITTLAEHYGVDRSRHKSVTFNRKINDELAAKPKPRFHFKHLDNTGQPGKTKLPKSWTYERAYHQLMRELVDFQCRSLDAALGETKVRKLFIDGGFSDNAVYVKLIAHRYRHLKVRTTDSSLGSALGAAIAISDKTLDSKFLKQNYGLRKHQPYILN
ncbi:FGGY-family carbohydrate kinase [Lewinella sp. 4G2]|uniref:FGGY-family carbohydrate kinase n=1 Tax=Lewinella sp. 4G2 TaxID=1803372 RepID=UPI0007B4C857|nr:FGGY family carbohydrate kinase [Lewinella sp. 4G2]OAV45054.1 carbohydrate kinase [Lewinella sp. 4G2]